MGVTRPSRVRFGVLGFVCSLSLITYLDRICIMRVQGDLQRDLTLSDVQLGLVFAAFSVGYALFEIPGGWMGDAWGTRRVIARIVLWWSLFTAMTGLVWKFTLDTSFEPLLQIGIWVVFDGFLLLLLVRFLFGCGEAGAYPNLARVVGAWFPFRERALAQGSIWMFARLGGAIAPFVIGRLTVALGWRPAFWILGAVGVLWCFFFYRWFRNTPEEKPACNEAEREEIRAGPYSWKAADAAAGHVRPPWRKFLRSSNVWSLCLAGFCVSFAWYFYPTWQPRYLKDVHGIDYRHSEILTGLPFLCGAVGSILGGGLSDRLIRVTGSRRWGRSLVGLVGFTGAGICVLFTGMVPHWWQAVLLLCLAFFINDLAIPPIWAVAADIGGRYAGTLSGIMNTCGAVGAVLAPTLIPVVLGAFGPEYPHQQKWMMVFMGLAGLWFIAALAWLGIDASKPIEGTMREAGG